MSNEYKSWLNGCIEDGTSNLLLNNSGKYENKNPGCSGYMGDNTAQFYEVIIVNHCNKCLMAGFLKGNQWLS